MNIHIIMHESFEAPGAIRTWGENKKHKITYTHLYQKEVLPLNTKAIDFETLHNNNHFILVLPYSFHARNTLLAC